MISEKAKIFIEESIVDASRLVDTDGVGMLVITRKEAEKAVEIAEKEIEEKLTRWHDIPTDTSGFATDDALDDIFRKLPRLVRDKRDGRIELIDCDNAAEWRGDLERKPGRYQWRPINE